MLVASEMTSRSENFKQLAREAGVWDSFTEQHIGKEMRLISELNL